MLIYLYIYILYKCTQACDEDVWREIGLFKGALRKMAAASSSGDMKDDKKKRKQERKKKRSKREGSGDGDGDDGRGIVFLETGGKPGSTAAKHAFIEAIPVSKSASLDAPLYFRQVILFLFFPDFLFFLFCVFVFVFACLCVCVFFVSNACGFFCSMSLSLSFDGTASNLCGYY